MSGIYKDIGKHILYMGPGPCNVCVFCILVYFYVPGCLGLEYTTWRVDVYCWGFLFESQVGIILWRYTYLCLVRMLEKHIFDMFSQIFTFHTITEDHGQYSLLDAIFNFVCICGPLETNLRKCKPWAASPADTYSSIDVVLEIQNENTTIHSVSNRPVR